MEWGKGHYDVVCPHCGFTFDSDIGVDDEYGYSYDTKTILDCSKCGKKYEVESIVTQKYRTRKVQ